VGPCMIAKADRPASPRGDAGRRMEVQLRALSALALILVIAACETAPQAGPPPMRIELLGFESCPLMPALRAALAEAAAAEGLAFAEMDTTRLDPRDPRRDWPCPTILVDGHDLMGLPCPGGGTTACRIYRDGLPSSMEIRTRLAERWRQGK
jgi:hypothetical protein